MMAKEELNNKKILLEEVNFYKIKKRKEKIKAKLTTLFKVDARVRLQSNICNDIFYHGTSKPLISKIIFDDDDDDDDDFNSDDNDNEEILENISNNIFTWKQKQLQFKESEINDSVDSIVIEDKDEDHSQTPNNSENFTHIIKCNILNENISNYQAEKVKSSDAKENVNVVENTPQNSNSIVNHNNLKKYVYEIPLIEHEKEFTSNILIEVLDELSQSIEPSINTEINNNNIYKCSNNVQSHESFCNSPTEDKTHNNLSKFPRIKSTSCRNLPKYSGKMASMAKNISRKTHIINKNHLSQKTEELNNEQDREPIKINEKDNNESSINFPRTKITGRRNIPKYSGKMASMIKHNSKVPKNHSINNNGKSYLDKSLNYLSLYITTVMLAYIKLNISNKTHTVQNYLELRNKYFTLSYPIIIKHYSIFKKDNYFLKILLKLAYIKLNETNQTCYYSEKLFCIIFNDILKQVQQSYQPPINPNLIPNPGHLSTPGNIENSICNILPSPFFKHHEQQNNLNNAHYLKNIINCPTMQLPHSSNMSSQTNSLRSLLDNSVIAPTVQMPNSSNICNLTNSSPLHMKNSTMCSTVELPNLSNISSQTDSSRFPQLNPNCKVNHTLPFNPGQKNNYYYTPQCQQNFNLPPDTRKGLYFPNLNQTQNKNRSTQIQNKNAPSSLLTQNADLSSGWYDESYQLHHKIPQKHIQQQRIPQYPIQQQVIPQKHIQQQQIPQYHNQLERIPQYPIQQQRIPQYPFQQQRIPQNPFQQKTVSQYPLQQESMLQCHHHPTAMYSIPLGIIPESQDMPINYSPNNNIEISNNKNIGSFEQNKCIRSISRDSGIMSPSYDGVMAE